MSGLAFDDQGRRLAPTHTKKGAKRYRYYVAQTLGATDQTDAKAVWWPTQALETVVIDALTRFLIDASRLVSLMGNVPAEETRTRLKQAAALAKTLLASHACGRIEILKRIVSRITVHLDHLDIMVRLVAVWTPSDVAATDASTTLIEVPWERHQTRAGVKLIVKVPGEALRRAPDSTLVATINKSHDWFGRLKSGRSDGVQAIADEEKVDRSYARRVIYLAFLDPEIVKRILRADHPVKLNATRLLRMTPLPLDWAEQRRLLGMMT